jgi:glycosyltransferase involved in cell wall biosynthesis
MKISIITPTYNRKDLLAENIATVQKSILAPYTDVTWEHIIYDDCSTDGTEEYVKSLSFPNLIYIRGEKNMRQSFAKNRAIEKATGDYIMVVDSDDVITQRALYHIATVIKKYPETEWFVTEYLHMDENLTYIPGKDYYGWHFKDTKEMLQAVFDGGHFIQSNAFFKKELWAKVQGFDETVHMGEDIDIYIKFLFQDKMPHYCPFITHLVRLHSQNMTVGIDQEKHLESLKDFKIRHQKDIERVGIKIS